MIQSSQQTGFRRGGLVGLIFAGIMMIGIACQVPVFRFALERWEADSYLIVIVPGESGELSEAEEEVRAFLQSQGNSESGAVNLKVRVEPGKPDGGSAATLSLFYPPKPTGARTSSIWSGLLTMDNARSLIDSPARQKIVSLLLSGESATWVLIESGNKNKDDHAAAEIERAFAEAEAQLKIPDGVLTVEEARKISPADNRDSDDALRSRIPLKIDFSLIRISRSDPDERIFREMLLHMEDDLGEFQNEPMVFPVFGRGRALEPLIARGINTANVFEHTSYFCGACSCEIKNQNPGVDLLINANWEAAISGNEVMVEKSLPPLMGTGALNDGSGGEEKGDGASGTDSATFASKPWLISGSGILLTLGLGSVLILRKNNNDRV